MDGAEIKTEGDSFYVVFPSASRAVAAGLAIAARAAEANAVQSGEPIRVGVGIHAGETEERAEGYVGTAVNIAARVCGLARPGEVLVTETVRSLTRTSGRYRFVARGRPALKGIAEPIAIFAAEDATAQPLGPDPSAPGRPARGRAALVVVLAGVAALGVGAIVIFAPGPGRVGDGATTSGGSLGLAAASSASDAATSTSTSSPTPSGPTAFHTGRLAAGSYMTTVFEPTIDFTVPDGWSGNVEIPNYLELSPFGVDNEGLAFMTPSIGFVPCSTTEYTPLPERREDLVEWIRTNPGLEVAVAGTVTLGGVEAVELQVGLGDGCHGMAVQPLFLIRKLGQNFLDQNDRWSITQGRASPIFVMDIGGRTVVALIGASDAKLDAFSRDAKTVLSSLEIPR